MTLAAAYGGLTETLAGLDEDQWRAPTRCEGWDVLSVVRHVLGDAQRALVAFATPSDGPPDRDAVTYWTDWPAGEDPEPKYVRGIRESAHAMGPRWVTAMWIETSEAAIRAAARATGYVETQGLVLAVPDFVATLTFEAAVHQLDLDLARPAPEVLAVVRATLDGLLGEPVRAPWDDVTYALIGTGREPVPASDRAALGDQADRFPLLG